MQHGFDVSIAQKYGILEAVLFNHFAFWIAKNKANNANFFDGKYWTYNSVNALLEIFPYCTRRKLQYALEKMQKEGLLISGNYNKSAYDRTLWYALGNVGESILQFQEIHFTNLLNGFSNDVQPIPDILPDNIPDRLPDNSKEKKEKKEKKERTQKPKDIAPTPNTEELQRFFGEAVGTEMEEWFQHKTQRRDTYTPKGLEKLLGIVRKNVEAYGEQAVADLIELSIASGWQGIAWDRLKQQKPSNPQNSPPRQSGNVFVDILRKSEEEGVDPF